MNKIKLVVADEDIYYLNNLTNYISTEFKDLISAVSFSSKELFLEYIKNEIDTDVFLVSTNFYDEISRGYDIEKLILLSNDNVIKKNIPNIYKYQPIGNIIKEIIKVYGENEGDKGKSKGNNDLITFYSPVGGIGTTTLSIATAIKLAESGNKVLYLNFEKIQSNGIFMQDSYSKYNFSDLLISIKEGGENFKEILSEGIIRKNELNLYYFNPIDSILDIEDISLSDIKELLNNIIEANEFSYIVIDLPSSLDSKYYYMFEKSLQNIIVMGQDIISSYKVDTILRQLDDISNFKFIFNMYNEQKEKNIPKIISVNLLPIIESIEWDNEIRGEVDILRLLKTNKKFGSGVTNIINMLI